ncbi:MAG: Holliday junction branch migration protein RuvA [Peptococcaceae bacterium]|nr:Holliday junction branch migration protein RuvA [Peptococcaceae bacterium]
MISYLKGTVMHKTAGSVMVLCGSVGYEVQIPSGRLLKYSQQQNCEFYIYYHQREDAVQLFGFESWAEREFFMTLLNVSGIGPKSALAMIGQSTLSGLYQAIAGENVDFLTKVPGIGKKTAQRLVLELKDKLPASALEEFAAAGIEMPEVMAAPVLAKDDITEVLLGLGYHESEIRKIYPELKKLQGADEQTIIKKALQMLARI